MITSTEQSQDSSGEAELEMVCSDLQLLSWTARDLPQQRFSTTRMPSAPSNGFIIWCVHGLPLWLTAVSCLLFMSSMLFTDSYCLMINRCLFRSTLTNYQLFNCLNMFITAGSPEKWGGSLTAGYPITTLHTLADRRPARANELSSSVPLEPREKLS